MDPSLPEAAHLRVLVLGGSSEASALVAVLRNKAGVSTVLSYAGRTTALLAQPVSTRVGGFGGVAGLVTYLQSERIDVLVDATHPFAEQMSAHAREAAGASGCPLIVVTRPAWQPQAGDAWHEVADAAAAVEALGRVPRRVFLTLGRLQLAAFEAAPQHCYVIRTIDPVGSDIRLPHMETIEARGPFEVDAEERLMLDHRIEMLVSKNSGGSAAVAKLEAARRLGIQVILIRRPPSEDGGSVADAIAAIDAHVASAKRGV